MDNLVFILYSLSVLTCYVIGVFMLWILENWEVITLIVTNIAALFVNPPKRKK